MKRRLPVLVLAVAALGATDFEVASIRLHKPPVRNMMSFQMSGPRVTLEAYTIAMLLLEAYHLKGYWQLSFADFPDRGDQNDVYYDVVARASDGGAHSRDEFRKMLQALLADRFKLSLHREMKPMPVYALTTSKNGPKLKKSTGDGECAVHIGPATGGQSYAFSNCSINRLVDTLGNGLVDRPVINETGLAENYDFRFVAMSVHISRPQTELTDISPFTAIQDLGLKLQSETAPIEIIAVDHFEQPSEN